MSRCSKRYIRRSSRPHKHTLSTFRGSATKSSGHSSNQHKSCKWSRAKCWGLGDSIESTSHLLVSLPVGKLRVNTGRTNHQIIRQVHCSFFFSPGTLSLPATTHVAISWRPNEEDSKATTCSRAQQQCTHFAVHSLHSHIAKLRRNQASLFTCACNS